MTFRNGETLYTQAGTTVAFDHDLNGMAYVHPILTVTRQVSNSRGDDFEEYDEEVLADHLIAVPYDTLTRAKPTALLDTQIAEKQAQLSEMNRQIGRAEADTREAMRSCDRVLADKQKELADWIAKYPLFAETAAFLAGEPVYALSVIEDHYNRFPHPPTIPKDEELRFLRLRPKTGKQASVRKPGTESDRLEWVAVTKGLSNDPRENLQLFFASDAERQDHIRNLFDKVCTIFRAKPDYSDNASYSSNLDMATLRKWITRFTFLTMPEDIQKGLEDHKEKALVAQRAELQRRLAALEGAE